MSHDPRRTFANADIAHASLRGQVDAPHYAEGEALRVTSPTLDIKRKPGAMSLERQSLYGWPVTVLQKANATQFLRDETMEYVGYLKSGQLGVWTPPTHRVVVRQTLLFAEPDFKCPDPVALSMGSFLSVAGEEGRFSRTNDGRYAITGHLSELSDLERDPASVAERLIGTPYLWGGNSAFGIDCSGLVQAACLACGIPCPGDSDMQASELGEALPKDTPLQRNDLLFWKGHVALVVSEERLIHANAFHMAVAYEATDAAIKRIQQQGDGPVTARRRLLLPRSRQAATQTR